MTRALIAAGLLGVVVGAVGSLVQPGPAVAATGINKTINFQGKLVNTDGTNVPDGTYNIEFKLYTGGDGVPGGGDETLQWTETRLRNNSQGVTVNDGIFQVNLGSVTALPAIFNDDTIWLSMNLGNTDLACTDMTATECDGDGEMGPFIRFTASPYALNSDLLDGLDSAAFGQLAATQAFTGVNTFRNTNQAAFSVQNASNANMFTVDTSNGRVGINLGGSNNPTEALEVNGNIKVASGSSYKIGSSTGAGVSCSGGQVLQNQVVEGGIVTGGSCATASATLQDSYNASTGGTTPEIKLDDTRKAIDIQDADGGVTSSNLFNIRASNAGGLGSVLFGVSGSGVIEENGTVVQVSSATGDANSITANSLTTGAAFKVTSANSTAANTPWSAISLNVTNAQATTAVSTGMIAGLDLQFTQNASVAGNNETVANLVIKQIDTSVTDNTVSSILNLANNDTATGNQVTVTDAIKINGAGITNGINFAGVATDITTGSGEDLVVVAAAAGVIDLNDSVKVGVLGTVTANTAAVCRDTSTNLLTACDSTNTTGRAYLQGGNSFGAAANLGTNDAFDLNLRTGGTTRLTLGSTGGVTVAANNNFGLASGTGTFSQTYTGTTTTAFALTADSLTSGGGLRVTSAATGLTGDLAEFLASGNNAGVTGNALKVGMTGASATGTAVNITQAGTGLALRVNDDGTYSDSTPFVVDATGKVGIGTAAPLYGLDLRTGSTVSQLHFSATDTDDGGYLTSAAPSNFWFSGGSIWNGSTWQAKATSTTLLGGQNGTFSIFGNTGLTVGNGFSPTLRFGLDASGNITSTATTIAASALTSFTTSASLSLGSTTDLTLGSNSTINGGAAANDDLTLQGTSNGTRTSSYILLQPTAGNVAVGHSSPDTKLHVSGGTEATLANGSGSFVIGAIASANMVVDENEIQVRNNTAAATLQLNPGGGDVSIGDDTGSANLFFGNGGNHSIYVEAQTASNTAGNNLTVVAAAGNGTGTGGGLVLQAGAGGATGAGGVVTVQGGNAGGGNNVGGNVSLKGGTGTGTFASTTGLVVIDTPTFTTATTQICAINCDVVQANVDTTGAVVINTTQPNLTVTLPSPTISGTYGRIVYVTAAAAAQEFTLSVNGGGTGNLISMKANTTATMVWGPGGWTAAGASSSTTLQAAYNNTLTSAGGAEIVLNPPGGNADGLTIRNNATTPIAGGILEVQSSIGTNLFSVNNLGTELAANGGSETAGGSSTTFPANTWTAAPAGGTVSRTVTGGEYVTGQAGAKVITTTTANTGITNNLTGNPVNTIGAKYQVSFTAKSSLSGTAIAVHYSRNGGTNLTACTDYGAAGAQNLSNTVWTKITCTITIDSATAATDPDLYIRKTDGSTAPTIYLDNLSFIRNDTTTQPSNVQVGGGINGGPVTLFTLDRSSAPPVANGDTTYLGSMYYDTTTGRIQCYESDGWGACGSPPDNIIVLTPEYTGAVLNGNGVGTLTADFCAKQGTNPGDLQVNTTFLCTTNGEARNYYNWTSPQATLQTYSIYVTYKLPSTFKAFADANTMKLTAYRDDPSDSNALASIDVYRKNIAGNAITQCGSTTNITQSSGGWETRSVAGDETTCGWAGGDYIIFKINMSSRSGKNVYIENLEFVYTNT